MAVKRPELKTSAATPKAQQVSVIVPCFNAGRMLRPALRSVFGQTFPDLEIIFVDNNSTDGSAALARSMGREQPRPFTFVECREQGVNRARNLGFAHATGDYIQWMDADDELAPDKIAKQVAALEADPSADIAYGDWLACRIAPDGRIQATPHVLAQVDDQLARTLAGVWYPPHLYLLRRTAADRLQAMQAWWPARPVATDVEYSAMAALAGMRFLYVAGAKVRYNIWSDGQISGGTPYERRLGHLAAIFQRLNGVEPGPGVRLDARHLRLLTQDWHVWRLSPAAVALTRLAGRRHALRRLADGRQIELRPREAAVVEALLKAPEGLATCHLALHLAEIVPELGGNHAAAVQTLQRLQAEGFMDCLARTSPQGV